MPQDQSLARMYNWQHQMVTATLPTGMRGDVECSLPNDWIAGDAILNLHLTHSPHFMRYLHMGSGVEVGFVGENGLNLLASSKHIVADGTFELVEDKLILTTLMAYHEGIAIPAAYLVSDLRTQSVYQFFFQVTLSFFIVIFTNIEIQKVKELTHGRMNHRLLDGL